MPNSVANKFIPVVDNTPGGIIELQDARINSTNPSNGQVLAYNPTSQKYEPTTPFSGNYNDLTNKPVTIVPVSDSVLTIWNTDPGIYILPDNCVVRYYGTSTNHASWTARASILHVWQLSATKKGFVAFSASSGTSQSSTPGWYVYGHSTENSGGITYKSFDIAIEELADVQLTSPQSNDILRYDATNDEWVNSAIKTINGNSIFGSGDVSIPTRLPHVIAGATIVDGYIQIQPVHEDDYDLVLTNEDNQLVNHECIVIAAFDTGIPSTYSGNLSVRTKTYNNCASYDNIRAPEGGLVQYGSDIIQNGDIVMFYRNTAGLYMMLGRPRPLLKTVNGESLIGSGNIVTPAPLYTGGERIMISTDGTHTIDLTSRSVVIVNIASSVTNIILSFTLNELGERQVVLKREVGQSNVSVDIRASSNYKSKYLSASAGSVFAYNSNSPRFFTIKNYLIDTDICMLTSSSPQIASSSGQNPSSTTWAPPQN